MILDFILRPINQLVCVLSGMVYGIKLGLSLKYFAKLFCPELDYKAAWIFEGYSCFVGFLWYWNIQGYKLFK